MKCIRMWLVVGAAFVCGAVGGAGVDEFHQRHAAAEDRRIFAAKLRCRALGEKYAKGKSTDFIPGMGAYQVSIEKIDYSERAHSCIAETSESFANATDHEVVDVVTQEVYDIHPCASGKPCNIEDKMDASFRRALAGTMKPIGR